MKVKFIIIILLLQIFASKIKSQEFSGDNFCVNAGITINVGSALNRVGLFVEGYYVEKQVQANLRIQAGYNLTSWGNLLKTPELQLNSVILYGFGKNDTISPNFNRAIAISARNKTGKVYSIAYSLNLYFDKIYTSQRTGTFAFEAYNFGIIHENDMFAQGHADKYRSAAILVYYLHENFMYATNIIMWHGDSFDKNAKTYRDTNYPARFGYKDLSKAKYGKFSHGIFSLQVAYTNSSLHNYKADIGFDSEHVRNIFQNKLIHEKWYMPKKYPGYKLEHYPMIMENGMPYLYKENQKVKRASFYYKLSLNSNLFY